MPRLRKSLKPNRYKKRYSDEYVGKNCTLRRGISGACNCNRVSVSHDTACAGDFLMTTTERAREIMLETIIAPEADRIIGALMDKRITFQTFRASHDMFTRFHAHARYLGKETGEGYSQIYNDAIAYAVGYDTWPVKVVPQEVDIASETITIDVQIPQSTTKATNQQLLCAYEYITNVAAEYKISLPERYEG